MFLAALRNEEALGLCGNHTAEASSGDDGAGNVVVQL